MDKRHKRRGSTTSLLLTLAVLLIVTLVIIFFPVDAGAKQPVTTATEQQDDIEATTLIHAGDMAPDFTVEMLDGSSVTLSKLQGKPTLLIFWATWCPPCREELTHVEKEIIQAFEDEPFLFLPISRGEEKATVEKFRKKMGYTFPMGLDTDQSIFNKFASNYIPRNFLIGKDGKIAYISVGYDEAEFQALIAEIKKALQE